MNYDAIKAKLKDIGQEQVLRFEAELDAGGRNRLYAQLAALDLDALPALVAEYVTQRPVVDLPVKIEPVEIYPRRPAADQEALYAEARAAGDKLLAEGKVAAFLVAGGQGTRLGYDGPKGEFPVTPLKQKPLFQVFAEQLRQWGKVSGKIVPWYIMTSEVNDAATRAFFEKHDHFGYTKQDVFFFMQGMMPAFGLDGSILLADKDSLALSPDGHGGSLRALEKSGALADMKRRGVEHLSYFQVDNPIVHTLDPLFLGLHAVTGSEMSSKTIPKAGPKEKVGNFCIGDGNLMVIEYSDLPDTLAEKTNPDGGLTFNAGSIAIHAISVAFVERLNAGGRLQLPWHRADKRVPHVNEPIPAAVNAVKVEQFVFDAIPLAKNAIVYETARDEEFSPVKNATGTDSPDTSRQHQVKRNLRWLREAGVDVHGEPTVEVSPLYAATAEQLKAHNDLPKQVVGETYLG
ncbi:MAG: UTP--glucose-1-phosphate uridylyltransferase [Phycisphaerae bacterium]